MLFHLISSYLITMPWGLTESHLKRLYLTKNWFVRFQNLTQRTEMSMNLLSLSSRDAQMRISS